MRSSSQPTVKVAIVHDLLLAYGGAERVLEAILALYPTADTYTFFFDRSQPYLQQRFGHRRWQTADRGRWPVLARLGAYFSLCKPWAVWHFSRLDLRHYDVVITSCHSYGAKAVRTATGATHLCYLYTPPRFLYGYDHEMWRWTSQLWLQPLLAAWRWWDRRLSQRPTVLVTSSREVQQRIAAEYHRDAAVIAPPVQVVGRRRSPAAPGRYFVIHSRLVRQKGVEFLVTVASQQQWPVKVIGDGYLLPRLRQLAGPTIEFCGFVTEAELARIYRGARALLYAACDEDFGIVPLEAQGYGVPVIAYRSGAIGETVQEGVTGYLYPELTAAALIATVNKLDRQPLSPLACQLQARRFSRQRFQRQLRKLIAEQRQGQTPGS